LLYFGNFGKIGNFAMKLTRRQEEFIRKMIELKREFAGPVRYSLLAERLGVSPFTAYDMLCLLEEKGFVTSEYLLPAEKSGPGRAERVFYPSALAQNHHQQIIELAGSEHLDGEALKAFALEKLRTGEVQDQELTEQMMARLVPSGQGEVRYCVEVMTIAALRLKNSPEQQTLLDQLPVLLQNSAGSCKLDLCLLGGFVYGLLTMHCQASPEWLGKLREHLQGYLDLVTQMSAENCNRLARQISTAFSILAQVKE
jgi:Mn-dependent DtxR family transcriptional regulator